MTRKSTNPCPCQRQKKQARQHWKAAQQKCQFCQEYDELKHNRGRGGGHVKPNTQDDGYDGGDVVGDKGEGKAYTMSMK
jgi:hypothetical protein